MPFASRDDGTEVKAITRGPSVLRGSKRNLAAVLGNFGTTEGIVLREHVGEGAPPQAASVPASPVHASRGVQRRPDHSALAQRGGKM